MGGYRMDTAGPLISKTETLGLARSTHTHTACDELHYRRALHTHGQQWLIMPKSGVIIADEWVMDNMSCGAGRHGCSPHSTRSPFGVVS